MYCSIMIPRFPEPVWKDPCITQDTIPNLTCMSLLLSPVQNLCLRFLLPTPQSPASLSPALLAPGLLFKLLFLSFLAPGRSTFPGNQPPLPAEVKSLSTPLPTPGTALHNCHFALGLLFNATRLSALRAGLCRALQAHTQER